MGDDSKYGILPRVFLRQACHPGIHSSEIPVSSLSPSHISAAPTLPLFCSILLCNNYIGQVKYREFTKLQEKRNKGQVSLNTKNFFTFNFPHFLLFFLQVFSFSFVFLEFSASGIFSISPYNCMTHCIPEWKTFRFSSIHGFSRSSSF